MLILLSVRFVVFFVGFILIDLRLFIGVIRFNGLVRLRMGFRTFLIFGVRLLIIVIICIGVGFTVSLLMLVGFVIMVSNQGTLPVIVVTL